MKTYRILYFKCSYTSEQVIRASSIEEAEALFRERKGYNSKILSINEVGGHEYV